MIQFKEKIADAISNATIIENTYYGIIDNLPSYLVKISYSCTDQTANCIYTVPVENDGTNFIATYLIEFSLNEENEMQVANVLSGLDATTKILKYEETPNDPQYYEKEIVKSRSWRDHGPGHVLRYRNGCGGGRSELRGMRRQRGRYGDRYRAFRHSVRTFRLQTPV